MLAEISQFVENALVPVNQFFLPVHQAIDPYYFAIWNTNLLLFQAVLLPVIFFSALYYLVAFTSVLSPARASSFPRLSEKGLPTISVQLPVYNDPVVARCIESCLKFDYPKDKYKIMVADDSTDPVTRKIIDDFARRHPDRVKVFRRSNRKGFKAGALNEVLKKTDQDFIVIFDSDFVPKKNFLRKIVEPFQTDEKIAIVQSNTKWLNPGHNIITRFASCMLYAYYNCVMPLTNKVGVAFLGGTGGAVRVSTLKKMGGWNERSLTEDSDLSVKLLGMGYKSQYLYDLEVRGEVPITLGALVKQQTRWAYGTTRVFVDNWRNILLNPRFNFIQRAFLLFVTLGYVASPLILLMVITGNLGWVLVPQQAVGIEDLAEFSFNMVTTSGFFFLGVIGLYRAGRMSDIPRTFVSMMTVGIALTATNFVAFAKALLGVKSTWIRTPKAGSASIYSFFKRLFKM